ncbi:hypothetical protein [Saliphagus sp. LR7]|uniref:hypothetical protein n=1 Tax=Saliphagus sp. LR7 TaxID=2282654 RepID=UPI000DF7CA47|nr:hypothetical protein [Saliphagus sp. LR7]
MTLFQNTDDDETELSSGALEDAPMSMGDPITAAATMSVIYSWYNFYVKGDKETGIFVGLWAPTLLGAASYLQQKEMYSKLKEGFSFGR